jgi:site-specific DNA-methyltransferase (adenine-specific)
MEVNKIIQGDCLEVMPNIPDKSIDMILCDLPYGTTACKWDTIIPFEPLWKQYKRIIKDNGAIVLTASQPFTSALVMSNIKMFKYCWEWDKVVGSNFVNTKIMPLKIYEDILVFYKKQPVYNPQMVLRNINNHRISGKSKLKKNNINNIKQLENIKSNKYMYPTTKIEINRLNNELNSKHVLHPTQKPVALFEYLIKTYTNKGDLVLDNCAGSGTTGVACKNLGRKYILIEKEEKYIEIIQKRINAIPETLFDIAK